MARPVTLSTPSGRNGRVPITRYLVLVVMCEFLLLISLRNDCTGGRIYYVMRTATGHTKLIELVINMPSIGLQGHTNDVWGEISISNESIIFGNCQRLRSLNFGLRCDLYHDLTSPR